MKKYYIFLLILICFISSTHSQNYILPKIEVVKINESIELTGKMDNNIWSKALPVELNYEIRPGDNIPAPQKTYVRSLYNDKFIYFAFQCFDTRPEEIRANISDRDRIFQDDYIIVAIDTYGDNQRAYEFALNPFGIQGDLLATNDNEDINFNAIWHGKAAKTKDGWIAEMAIPFSSMQFEEKDVQNWKLNIVRNIPRTSRHQISWARIDKNIPGFMTQAGIMEGLKNIKSGGSLELLPYAMGQYNGSLTDYDDPNSAFEYNDLDGRIGGGIKYSPSANFTLDAVINPDFSQIESDAAQISVNTTYALHYQEKRPFFLVGRELLNNPMYYSRSINNPLGAARIMGKSGKFTYMYLGAYDRNTVIVIPGEEQSNTVETNQKSFANIGRLKYEFGDDNYLGGMVLTRNLDGGSNYVLGFDWRYKFWKNWYFNGEVFASRTNELDQPDHPDLEDEDRKFGNTDYTAKLDGEDYSGTGVHLVLSHNQKHYNFYTVINSFTPEYQTYNGFFTNTGTRQLFIENEYVIYPKDSFIERVDLAVGGNLQFNFDGTKKEQVVRPNISLQMKGQTYLSITYLLVNDELFRNIQFDNINRFFFNLNTQPTKELSLWMNGQVGKFIYRDDNPVMGKGHSFSAGLTYKPTSQTNIDFSYSRARLSGEKTDELFYDGNIYRLVGIYQFNQYMFLRTIVQFDTFSDSFQFYPLFSYKLNAFTTFFVGATSDYSKYESKDAFINTDQQYFMKIQYLFGM